MFVEIYSSTRHNLVTEIIWSWVITIRIYRIYIINWQLLQKLSNSCSHSHSSGIKSNKNDHFAKNQGLVRRNSVWSLYMEKHWSTSGAIFLKKKCWTKLCRVDMCVKYEKCTRMITNDLNGASHIASWCANMELRSANATISAVNVRLLLIIIIVVCCLWFVVGGGQRP